MIRRICLTILVIAFCTLQNLFLTDLIDADAAQQEPSIEELERIAEEIAKELNEGRLEPGNIYISHFEGNKWSEPEIVSSENENARGLQFSLTTMGQFG